jgi:Holliday junction resolvase-like predicted endonuclease
VLTEDRVIDAVCQLLAAEGFEIVQRASAIQHGYDIVGRKGGVKVVIEAKGAGSSKAGTARFGMEFNSGQVFDHVAKAVLKAMRIVAAGTARAGVALPDNASHRREVEQVAPALRQAGVGVFWVNERDEVRVDAPWEL